MSLTPLHQNLAIGWSIFDDADEIILDVQFGEGGNDSKMFVDELFAAYLKYSRTLGLQAEVIHSSDGHMIAKISGKKAGRAFKNEPGKHCVQRVPETESKGRKQTSMITVGVLPIKSQEDDEPLRDQDIEITTQCGHGPGGQHQNKTASAVRMKHKPTGITVFINGRDQYNNKIEARKILTARVNDKARSESESEYSDLRKSMMGDGGRSDKVRTYNFMRSDISDHKLNKSTGNVKAFMKGEFKVLFGK